VDNSNIEPIMAVLNEVPVLEKKKTGRPLGSVKPKSTKKALGRPKEIGTKVQELKERLLNSADSTKLVNKVIAKALDDNDRDQMVALKLCLDRILPVSLFEKAKDSRSAIQINITGLTDVVIDDVVDKSVEDAVYVDKNVDQ
jgi:hypothetical protein